MPQFAALIKVTNCRALGATVVLHGDDLAEARATPKRSPRATDSRSSIRSTTPTSSPARARWPSRSSSRRPTLDAIVVPVGGGGLLAGHRHRRQGEGGRRCASSASSPSTRRASRPRWPPGIRCRCRCRRRWPTASPCAQLGALPFDSADARRRRASSPSTRRSIALAILRLDRAREERRRRRRRRAAGRVPRRQARHLKGRSVVLVAVRRQHRPRRCSTASSRSGLVADGRLARFTVSISDRPGGLARLAEVIASTGASDQGDRARSRVLRARPVRRARRLRRRDDRPRARAARCTTRWADARISVVG